MAQYKGMLVVCDRCGEQAFLKTIGEGEADGGYTRWNKFEQKPSGWDSLSFENKWYTLCPVCNAKYSAFVKSFLERSEGNG